MIPAVILQVAQQMSLPTASPKLPMTNGDMLMVNGGQNGELHTQNEYAAS